MSSHLKSKYFIGFKVKSGISDFRVSSKKNSPDLILLHFSRACSMSSTSPAIHVWHVHSIEPILSWKYIQCSMQHLPQA